MSRTGENIYKRKDGRWEGRYIKSNTAAGKTAYGYVYGKTYREAKVKLQEAISHSSMEEKTVVNTQVPESFRELAGIWLESIRPKIKSSTANKYQNLLNSYVFPALGELTLDHITHRVIEESCNVLLLTGGTAGTGLSPKTVADALSLIRRILAYAAANEKEIKCDAKAIKIRQASSEMCVFSVSEQEQLCRYLYANPTLCNTGILVSLFTGLRIGEICALRWEDISLEERTIHVCRTVQRIQVHSGRTKTEVVVTTPKSVCSIRTIPVPDGLAEIMAVHQTDGKGFFLTGSEEKFIEPRTMQNRFKKVLRESGIADANYHMLRHTFATRCIELGFDVKSLSEILGHASVTITMNRYVHPSMKLKKENMQRLSEFLAVR